MMEDLLRVVFLLCAIAAPGHSLSCLTCAVKDSKCKGTSVTCPTGSSCGLAYQETTEDGITTKNYMKMCMPSDKCGKVGSISYSGGQRKMGTSCCNKDNCSPTLPKLPEDSSEPNGLTCPTCRSTTSNSCDSQSDIECTGNEKMCVNQGTVTSVYKESVMGCTTQSICDMEDLSYNEKQFKFATSFTCDLGTKSTETVDADIPNSTKSLKCFKCATSNGTCTGIEETCPPDHSCGLIYRETSEDDQVFTAYIKSCLPTKNCDKVGSITHALGNMKLGTSCCNTDRCTPPLPKWSSDSSESNGFGCFTCRSYRNTKCNLASIILCKGKEQTCAQNVLSTQGHDDTAVGCGTPEICDLGLFNYTNNEFYLTVGVTCKADIRLNIKFNINAPLSCVACSASDSLECNGDVQQCPEDHVCASIYRGLMSGGKTKYTIDRSCVPKDKCDVSGTMSLYTEKSVIGTSCCSENGCTPSIKLPKFPVKTKPNGVICKLCGSIDSESCESTNTMECSGDENQCVNYANVVYSPGARIPHRFNRFVLAGCGNEALCNMKNVSFVIKNSRTENIFTCTKG